MDSSTAAGFIDRSLASVLANPYLSAALITVFRFRGLRILRWVSREEPRSSQQLYVITDTSPWYLTSFRPSLGEAPSRETVDRVYDIGNRRQDTAMAVDASQTLANLASLQEQPLSIIRLSEPVAAPQTSTRTSDASNSALDNPTPASLEADLSHYKVRLAFSTPTVSSNQYRNSSPNYDSPTLSKLRKRGFYEPLSAILLS